MYVIRNALKCISRSKGRNILIGIIVLAISVSACLGLSICQAAESAKEETLAEMSVTATISFDRQLMMNSMREEMSEGGKKGGFGGFDRGEFSQMMGEASALTLEEYTKYASADTVEDFYYQLTAALNGSEDFLPVSNDSADESEEGSGESSEMPQIPGGMGGKGNMMMGAQSDFSVVGVSSEAAMSEFLAQTSSITDGEMFTLESEEFACLISQELAVYNDLSVGDTVVLTNPNNEEEIFQFTVSGIYANSASNESSFSMMGATSTDPANKLYMSYATLSSLCDASALSAETLTDEDTGREYSTEINGTLSATYSFASVEDYETFAEEVYEMGLDESYTVSSSDITEFENSLTPLNTLSTTASYFLIVILIIGSVVLIVLGIFNVRERKYEIGVLTAMGMKKGKVALQFLTEIFAVTMVAVIIGITVGGVTSVPVTNALLEGQSTAQTDRADRIEQSFGRGEGMSEVGGEMPEIPNGGNENFGGFGDFGKTMSNYITEIDSAMNFTVVLQMLGIAVLLTIASGAVSMLFVMRYDPLRILANRD